MASKRNPASAGGAETGLDVLRLAAEDIKRNTAQSRGIQPVLATLAVMDAGRVIALVATADQARALLIARGLL
jgi:hypothetical protein